MVENKLFKILCAIFLMVLPLQFVAPGGENIFSLWATQPNKDLKYLINVQKLLEDLKSEDNELRCTAIEKLGKLKDKRYTPYIIDSLCDKNVKVVENAIKALGNTDEPVSIQALKKITGQDFKQDASTWRAWWKKQKE